MMCDSIVVEWLRTLGLSEYSEAFADNGYDELEVCKQVGAADLDAIGVSNPLHRKILLNAVQTLLSEGATPVYFTLEEMNRSQSSSNGFGTQEHALIPKSRSVGSGSTAMAHHSRTLTNQSDDQRRAMNNLLRQMSEDHVDITQTPYITPNGEMCIPVLTALAMRYADQLGENYYEVMQCMERIAHLHKRHKSGHGHQLSQDAMNVNANAKAISTVNPATDSIMKRRELYLGQSDPPAIPSLPPPRTNNNNMTEERSKPIPFLRSQSEVSGSMFQHSCYPMSHHASGTLQHTCGRGMRMGPGAHHQLSGYSTTNHPAAARHCSCPQAICDQSAVYEQKRLDTLTLVRQGKLSVNDAMSKIREFEKQRNAGCEKKKQKKSTTTKIGEFFKLSSFRRKKNKGPPSSSTSSTSPAQPGRRSSDGGMNNSVMEPHMYTLSEEMAAKCTCHPSVAQARVPQTSTDQPLSCTCDDCVTLKASNPFERANPVSPTSTGSHRSSGRSQMQQKPTSGRQNKAAPGCDVVRAPPCCRECSTPLSQRQVRPMFYSPQVTRKTYHPQPTPGCSQHTHRDKGYYQKNLPSDDETRYLIDSCQSDDSSSLLSVMPDQNGRSSFTSIVRSDVISPPPQPAPTNLMDYEPRPSSRANTAQLLHPERVKGQPKQGIPQTTSDIGTSYHSDSLSSEGSGSNSQQQERSVSSQGSSPPGRVRRDSGCFVSNENINHNSSGSSTAEKDSTRQTGTSSTPKSHLKLTISRQMTEERITLTEAPYTDEEGTWCVPISLVSRYAQLCQTDLTSIALAMDSIRCSSLQRVGRSFRPLTADTNRKTHETKTIACVQDFLFLCGLPMYMEQFRAEGYDSLPRLAHMKETDLRRCGVTEPSHIKLLMSAINSTWQQSRELRPLPHQQSDRV